MAEPRVRVELATPNRLVVSEEVDEVVAPGVQGYRSEERRVGKECRL